MLGSIFGEFIIIKVCAHLFFSVRGTAVSPCDAAGEEMDHGGTHGAALLHPK